ncbi:alpha-glucosidase [Schaalia sp. ZJ1691]|uniref:glycoside hydrolase family 13 protein n=1 Tax=Schaalia sp. ZJ1691 TaxID=2709404 RepID=UPI0013EB9C18|nr:alpha-glucosidase [Schaalia sp. ZJ1691]
MSQLEWWKHSTVYQVYPRSFQDSNGDGIGDIPGVTQRVPYLHSLGVDIVWLSPVYRSPMVDNGYDISDYDDIDPQFGSLADLDELITTLHDHGMKLVMDLVVNHTSDQHPWFRESRDPHSPKHDWYFWRDPRPGVVADENADPLLPRGDEPSEWSAVFSGPAWTWDREVGQYYLHFFTREQPDLNWDNPEVREAIYQMMRRWLDRGVDGFRMDVISMISKPADLYTDDPHGISASTFGPHFHDYLQEMRREVFDRYPDRQFFTVGETAGATPEIASLISDPQRRELDMIFQFEHMLLDATNGDKFRPRPLALVDMKANLARWSAGLHGRGWNSLYLSNHDQPRPVSRYGDPVRYRHRSATAWSGMLHAHPGTPFVYQGEELGMGNYPWTSLDEFNDVEVFNTWRSRVIDRGEDPDVVFDALRYITRDNARTPMQWDATVHAGFTQGTPWLAVNPDHVDVNAYAQVGVEGSTFEFFRQMISLRHRLDVLVTGSFELLEADDPTLWWIRRTSPASTLEALANMSGTERSVEIPNGTVVLSNVPERERAPHVLAPWEIRWIIR